MPMNHIVGKNHITPAGSKISGKWPYSAQKSRGSTDQWTGARNTTDQVMAADLRGVLVAISIPIFTAQLEKAREATDLANVRSAYAEVQTAALTETTADDLNATNGKTATFTVSGTGSTYKVSAEVTLTQKKDDWQTANAANAVAGIVATGTPTAGGTATIAYDASTGKTTIVYA